MCCFKKKKLWSLLTSQGCDGSVLLDGSAGGPSEKSELPNLTLRKEAFKIINDLRDAVHKQCGRVVSCSDIVAIAARDSVVLVNCPAFVNLSVLKSKVVFHRLIVSFLLWVADRRSWLRCSLRKARRCRICSSKPNFYRPGRTWC